MTGASVLCCLMIFVVGSTSAAFPDGFSEVRNARTYDRFFGKEKHRLWVIWTDLNGKDYDFRYPVEKDGVPKSQDQKKVYNRTFPCGSSGVRFLHEGGKEVFIVHPVCSMCMATFGYVKPGWYQPHGIRIEFRCYKDDGRKPAVYGNMNKPCTTSDAGYKHILAWILYLLMPLFIMLKNYT